MTSRKRCIDNILKILENFNMPLKCCCIPPTPTIHMHTLLESLSQAKPDGYSNSNWSHKSSATPIGFFLNLLQNKKPIAPSHPSLSMLMTVRV